MEALDRWAITKLNELLVLSLIHIYPPSSAPQARSPDASAKAYEEPIHSARRYIPSTIASPAKSKICLLYTSRCV